MPVGVVGPRRGRLRVAAWQQHRPRTDGRFDTRIYVQRVAPVPDPAAQVWAGITIGPGPIETVQAAGRQTVLYAPQIPGKAGLTACIKPLR